MQHSIQTHNGFITMHNRETGGHRTLRIRTQPEDSGFAPGERVIGLLTGSDNESDYRNFGFVKQDGRVIVWKRHRGTVFETYARMIERPEIFEAKGVEYLFDTRCRRCNRTLTEPTSVTSGIGPICSGRER